MSLKIWRYRNSYVVLPAGTSPTEEREEAIRVFDKHLDRYGVSTWDAGWDVNEIHVVNPDDSISIAAIFDPRNVEDVSPGAHGYTETTAPAEDWASVLPVGVAFKYYDDNS